MGLCASFFPPSLLVHVHLVAVNTTLSWGIDSARRPPASEKSEDSTVAFLHVNLTGPVALLPIMVCLHYSPADPLSGMTQFSRIFVVLDTVDALFMGAALPSSLLRDIRCLTYQF